MLQRQYLPSTCPSKPSTLLCILSVENKWLKHRVILPLIPTHPPTAPIQLDDPATSVSCIPLFFFLPSPFPLPIYVKNKTVSNTTMSDNTVIDRAVTTNTVIASASQCLPSSICTICWVFREYLTLQSVTDNTNSSGQQLSNEA